MAMQADVVGGTGKGGQAGKEIKKEGGEGNGNYAAAVCVVKAGGGDR